MAGTAGGSGLPASAAQAAARCEVLRAVETMIREAGGRTIAHLRSSRQDWPRTNTITLEPIAGLESAHAIEQAVHALIKDLSARRAKPGAAAGDRRRARPALAVMLANESIANVAYDYALSY